MESATNLIFLIAACTARSGGNAVRAPPRAHLAQTVPWVEPAALDCPSSAQQPLQGQGCFPACAHSSLYSHRPGRCEWCWHASASASPSRARQSQGMTSARSHLEPEAPVEHFCHCREQLSFSKGHCLGTYSSLGALRDLRESPFQHTTHHCYKPKLL